MDVEQLTQQLQEFAKTRKDIAAIYLFGSQAKNTARPDSDVDIALLVSNEDQDLFYLELKLNGDVGKYVTHEPLEVFVANRLPIAFKFHILSQGKKLVSNDERFRVNWEVNVMGDYWDFKPFLDEYYRAFFKRMKEEFTDDQRREYERARAAFAGAH